MDKLTLNKWYESYKKANDYGKKAMNVGIAVQGLQATNAFAQYREADSLHIMINSMNHFLNMNPIGKLMVRYYQPHFKLLEYVVRALNANDNQLTRAIDEVNKELELFIAKAPAIVLVTRFDSSELMQGQISYTFYLASKENALGNSAMKQIIPGFVKLVAARAQEIVSSIDKILAHYLRLQMNYQKLVQEGKLLYQANEAKGGLTAAFSRLELMEFTYGETGTGLNGQINELLKNRNNWAQWLDQRPLRRDDYLLANP